MKWLMTFWTFTTYGKFLEQNPFLEDLADFLR